jgi:hypothetical protein
VGAIDRYAPGHCTERHWFADRFFRRKPGFPTTVVDERDACQLQTVKDAIVTARANERLRRLERQAWPQDGQEVHPPHTSADSSPK